ncbi:hypothetical protein JCM16303_004255 [Sporobolomyces ruberrimus]
MCTINVATSTECRQSPPSYPLPPYPSVLSHGPSTSELPLPLPNPEVYAKAYEILRERWHGREEEMILSEQQTSLKRRERPCRRDSSRRRSSLEHVVARSPSRLSDEEEEEPETTPLKRSRTSASSEDDHLISFFDNPPPSSTSTSPSTFPFDSDGFRLPQRRSQSLSPKLPSSSSSFTSNSNPNSTRPTVPRKRSVSQPCESRRLPVSTHHHHHLPRRQRSFEPFVTSQPILSGSSSSNLFPPSSTGTPTTSRSEALLHVVKSFEVVLACRAEGWRRLASRKNSATSSIGCGAGAAGTCWTVPPPSFTGLSNNIQGGLPPTSTTFSSST